jgi:HAD superfamily hydrolase (TIGR01549 family)
LELIVELNRREIKTAFFSDYPAKEKLAVLGLSSYLAFCATDINVNRLKPDPKSLLLAAQVLGVPVCDCLCIGDRDDRDGEAARRAGMEYLLLKRNRSRGKKTFQSYFQLIDEIRLMS